MISHNIVFFLFCDYLRKKKDFSGLVSLKNKYSYYKFCIKIKFKINEFCRIFEDLIKTSC